jgi:hypothetical protein
MLLIVIFLILFTSWMLWGWIVGESRDIRWMRNWCAGIFVVLCILLCLGGGAWFSRQAIQSSCRSRVQEFTRLLYERMEEGRIDDVRDALQHISEEPDEWSTYSRDRLQRMDEVTEALRKTARSRVATKHQTLQ